MKKTITLSVFLLFTLILKAQYTPSQIDTNARYCLILATKKLIGNGVTIDIDFGQPQKWWKNTTKLIDSTGNRILFNSVIDALNYMNKNGWEFVDAYAITIGNYHVYHYLMRKRD